MWTYERVNPCPEEGREGGRERERGGGGRERERVREGGGREGELDKHSDGR